jgi:hypothetical protein
MPLSANLRCKLEPKPSGWWLTFPATPTAGLLLTEAVEQVTFAQDCGVTLTAAELNEAWVFTSIVSCPRHWYQQAKTFPPKF